MVQNSDANSFNIVQKPNKMDYKTARLLEFLLISSTLLLKPLKLMEDSFCHDNVQYKVAKQVAKISRKLPPHLFVK